MPIIEGKNKNGPYIKYGESGYPYPYKAGDKESKDKAKQKALKQARAMYADGYKGK